MVLEHIKLAHVLARAFKSYTYELYVNHHKKVGDFHIL
jgi:hypothetical protein